jgi:hypothetical protein
MVTIAMVNIAMVDRNGHYMGDIKNKKVKRTKRREKKTFFSFFNAKMDKMNLIGLKERKFFHKT